MTGRSSQLRFWRGNGRHRAEGDADISAYRASFKPHHCAGDACFHDHAGEPVVWGPEDDEPIDLVLTPAGAVVAEVEGVLEAAAGGASS